MTVDLVVSHYRDSLEWVEPLTRPGVRVFVYDKWDGPYRAGYPGAVKLANRGLCDHTYAHHIVTHYDDLADWTVFSPDGPHDHLPEGASMADALTPGDSLKVPRLFRGRDWNAATGRLNWHQWASIPKRGGTNWKEHYESGKITPAPLSFVEWMRKYIGFDPNGADWPGYSPGGILAVPRRAITYLPVAFYARLREQLAHAVESEVCHYCERSWTAIFTGVAHYKPEDASA